MKNPVNIAKKSYDKILKIDNLAIQIENLAKKQEILSEKIDLTISLINSLSQNLNDKYIDLNNTILTEYKTNSLRFNALYGTPKETLPNINRRFLENIPPAAGALRTFQLGNVKLLKKFIDICTKNKLPYFAQSGTLLGAVRHQGFVPWDDDTDMAMFRDDIFKLRDILKKDKAYRLTLVYDYYVKSRQLRFRTTDPENPCFIDVYIYDYGDDDSDKAWDIWQKTKIDISNKIEQENPAIIEKWREVGLADEATPLGKQLKPIFEKYYDSQLNSNLNKANYSTVNWSLDNFPIKWKRLFKKDFIFPTKKLTYEGLKISVPNQYDKYLERQYGNIYELPKDLVTHYQHINHSNINIDAIEKFLSK